MTNQTFIYDVVDNGATGLLALANSEEQFRYLAEKIFTFPIEEITVDYLEEVARSAEEFLILGKLMNIVPLDEAEVEEARQLA